MSQELDSEPSEFLANHIARRGTSAIEDMQATVDRAREIAAASDFQVYQTGEDPLARTPFEWEISSSELDKRRRVYLGTVTNLATGQGQTVYFAASLARDADEFRRKLAGHLDRYLANAAKVKSGVGDFPFSKKFIPPSLHLTLQRYDAGKDAPPGFFYLAQWAENRS